MESLTMLGAAGPGLRCVSCGKSLEGSPIYGYPHSGGIYVGGRRLWVYVECRYCRYQNSARALGITDLGALVPKAGGDR
ncbi:MAG: hypothetical protein QXP81_01515 [Nitrososphaerota archaeon]